MPSKRTAAFRICSNAQCFNEVKKKTAKYCCVQCCASDPNRHERIRKQVRRSARRYVLPLAKQLTLDPYMGNFNPELELSAYCLSREDVPSGLARLVS